MDKLYIQGLALKTTIGCLAWEKQLLQTVIVDLEMGVDCAQISREDVITATIDYATLVEKLTAFVAAQRCQLIETLAENIALFIHQHAPEIQYLKIALEKPGAVAGLRRVGVVIEREFNSK
ncbi:MAG TPA: dihydroneopterin aldolase [Gammaproteobacteria bacterium]|nr:dihydroneopterin aldolase [Gammaproteobacteria bacterium]